jgi:ectoine hydroxylase-related dioxygenase (phytanoyl-CoA dioxygenase family)
MGFLDTFDEWGFAIVPSVLSPEEVQGLVAGFDSSSVARSKAGIRHVLRHQAVADIAKDPRLIGIAQDVLGSTAQPFRATLFDKSAEANWLVVWHQDTALPLRHRREIPGWGPWSIKNEVVYAHAPANALSKVLALRVHLDDSNEHNGPLRVLPGTHKDGVLSDDALQELSAQTAATECLVSPGGVLAMRPLLVHSSSKSKSAISRRVLHIEYAESMIIEPGVELAIA